jgi:hypothetical protein
MSLISRFAIAFLVLASGLVGFLINEFFYIGEQFIAGVSITMIPAFAIVAFNHLKPDETYDRRLRRVRRA